MYCDASGLAIAAVLIQLVSLEQENEFRIISMAHKKLSISQRIYSYDEKRNI
jgi:hypothetical protein